MSSKSSLSDLPLSDAAGKARLGEKNALRAVLDTVLAYEAGSWDEALTSNVIGDETTLSRASGQRARLGA